MQKVRYELDPYNRLVIEESGDRSDFRKFRQVLDGRFETDEFNNLSYHIKSPISEDEKMPRQIRLRGEWSLTDDHSLRLTLDKSARYTFGDQITLQGELMDADNDSLLFAVTTRTKDNIQSTHILTLSGSWKADENNRLSFHVRREKGACDILIFTGAWEVNKAHQIIYQYEKAELIRKKRSTHTLIFKGYWDIKERMQISYVLSEGSDSVFDFSASAGTFEEDYIKYEVGVGLSNRRDRSVNTITLSGSWNLKKDAGLIFKIEYEDGRTRAITFGAEIRLTDRDTVSFGLKNEKEFEDIGIDLELSRNILEGDGEAILRVLASRQETAIYAGAAWRW